MKKIICFVFITLTAIAYSQEKKAAFKSGEWLKYRMHYGLVNAGYATIEIKEIEHEKQKAYHVVGNGWTVGVTKFFFKVQDNYESWFYKDSLTPYKFKRRVDEGGYIISRDITFDHEKDLATIEDHKLDTVTQVSIKDVQDMISSFYYLRSQDINQMKIGEELKLGMFFDGETFDFRMKYLGTEVIRSDFGKIKCHKFIPIVKSGRVFEADESLKIWVTADENKIPIRIKAELAVGSLKADLDDYNGVINPFIIEN